jgi:hypothetical protein
MDQAWDLLAKLPTNATMESSIASFHTAAQAPKWAELIDPTSAFSLLYALRIVKSALQRDRETVRASHVPYLILLCLVGASSDMNCWSWGQ